MKNISFFKKIRIFLYYRKAIKNLQDELERSFNVRIDNAYRLYTVLNVSDELIDDENYLLDSKYLEAVTQKQLREYTNKLSQFLNSKGLNELFKFYNISVVGKYSYLLVYGFSLFKSDVFYKWFYRSLITLATLIISFILIKTFI